MICTQLIGGLGNQMFQYALGRRLSSEQGCHLILDLTAFKSYSLHPVDILKYNVKGRRMASGAMLFHMMRSSPVMRTLTGFELKTEGKFSYEAANLQTTKKNVYLQGYWQSEKYFNSIRSLLLDDFELMTEAEGENKRLLDNIERSNSVSLHIRRGDYVSNPSAAAVHGTLPISYYVNALRELETRESDLEYFVFSDDPAWVQANMPKERNLNFVTNNSGRGYEDLRLMKACKHQIIANSTFSWWGAWLNRNENKRVFAPAKWFLDKSLPTEDLLPESWKKVALEPTHF